MARVAVSQRAVFLSIELLVAMSCGCKQSRNAMGDESAMAQRRTANYHMIKILISRGVYLAFSS